MGMMEGWGGEGGTVSAKTRVGSLATGLPAAHVKIAEEDVLCIHGQQQWDGKSCFYIVRVIQIK